MIGEEQDEGKDKKMPKTAVKERPVQHREEETPPVSTITPRMVLDGVLRRLGKPSNMSKVSPSLTRATAVTQNSFRVNIYTDIVKSGFTANELTHTYFVHVDEDGKVMRSNPEIIKQYE